MNVTILYKSSLYKHVGLICVTKTNFMHNLSSVYFLNQLLHVSGILVTHHQEVHCVYTTNWYVLYIRSLPPDDGLQICPKHVVVD